MHSEETLDARQKRVTDKCHDTSFRRARGLHRVADRIGPARHLDDSTMRSVVPIQTPHGVLLKRCAPPDENHSLFASSNNMEVRLREGAKMH